MPNFIKFGWTGACWQYGETYSSRTLKKIISDFSGTSTEKVTKPFQALNGLKCSTVSNLGS